MADITVSALLDALEPYGDRLPIVIEDGDGKRYTVNEVYSASPAGNPCVVFTMGAEYDPFE